MNSIWTVCRYSDQLKERDIGKWGKLKTDGMWKFAQHPELFDHEFTTEAEARTFIVARARQSVKGAEYTLKKARENLRKCEKKFGT